MELRHRAASRLIAALLASVAVLLLGAPSALAAELERPSSETKPPHLFERSARSVEAIATRAEKVRAERRERGRPLRAVAYMNGVGRWQVSFFDRGDEVAQVQIDDRSGAILEQWRGPQVAWTMARGYEGAFGRKLNAPYVWLPLCALFLLPFVDVRRPFRLLHLDLLALLGFGASHLFFNRGQVGVSVPLVVPVLAYLFVRCLLAGLRPRVRRGPLVPHVPTSWLAMGIVLLLAFRVGLNVLDSNVVDVGYAGVIGADRIVDGDPLYGDGFSKDVGHGDTYGPVAYLAYVPFEQALPWSGRWDDLPAAHGAAIAFDLLTLAGLMLVGRRLRRGAEGRTLGVALGWAWVSFPYTAFALETNANDSLVALLCVLALLALMLDPPRAALSALGRGVAVALAAATKLGPLLLAPLFATAGERRRGRDVLLFGLAFAAALAATVAPFVPDGGLRELYDRTLGYQAGRPAPFSVWGQEPSVEWLQTAVEAGAVALALLVALVPRRKDPRQVAALGAAVLILTQLATTYWFYLYVVWFTPFVLVAVLAVPRAPPTAPRPEPVRERHPAPPPVPA